MNYNHCINKLNKMKKVVIAIAIMVLTTSAFAQSEEPAKNGFGANKTELNYHLGVDLQTKYIWRGMEMISNDAAPVLFPNINYSNKGFYAYVMGGYSINGKYSEVDLGLSYTYKWIAIGVNDYYYPTTTTPQDQYFNFKARETGHWFEAVVTIAPEKIPVFLTISNFFGGADKNLDGKQAYSTYAELGAHYDFLNDHQIALAAGMAFNKSCYNGYDHGTGVCNVELKYTYNLTLNNSVLPLSVAYIINPVYEKAHVNFIANFSF